VNVFGQISLEIWFTSFIENWKRKVRGNDGGTDVGGGGEGSNLWERVFWSRDLILFCFI